MKIIKDVREEFKFNNEIHLTSLIATVSKKWVIVFKAITFTFTKINDI